MVEITQWPILIALFSQCVPPSRVCYCRMGGYAGQGGDAEPAKSEHFLSNNLKSCGVEGGHVQEGRECRGSGCLPVGLVRGEEGRRGVAMQSARSPGLLGVCER